MTDSFSYSFWFTKSDALNVDYRTLTIRSSRRSKPARVARRDKEIRERRIPVRIVSDVRHASGDFALLAEQYGVSAL
jgi:hypothetical protein